jgi:SAM-dependent methyltransferase
MIDRLGLSAESLVVEVASNDGYLLKFFKERSIPVLGIEPAANIAAIANAAGIRSLPRFFGAALATDLANSGTRADLLVGNNVLAHVPELNDFVRGLATLLAPRGVLTLEFPHLGHLLEETQFDTIYHEHFSYFSLATAERALARHGLEVFDVEVLPTHGGSLRVFARHEAGGAPPVSAAVTALRSAESTQGLDSLDVYASFAERVQEVKRGLLEFLIRLRREGKHVVGYGAAAKGNTLLNYCGIRTDFLDYVADRNPLKQGKLLPGTRIPVVDPARIRETRPSHVLVLPWNIRDEVSRQLSYVKEWGGQLFVPLPRVELVP